MKNKFSLSSCQLKWIALITMLIDHIGLALLWDSDYYFLFRIIGRIAFPLYCFMIVEGFLYTHNLKKYFFRLGIFAILSEIPFNYIIGGTYTYPDKQNVFFTLLLGLAAISAYQYFMQKNLYPLTMGASLVCILLAYVFQTDYSSMGVLLIIVFYLFRYFPNLRDLICALILSYIAYAQGNNLEAYGMISLFLIHFYHGEKGTSHLPALVFYAFYPVHLIIIYMISIYLFPY